MTSPNSTGAYLPPNIILSEDWAEASVILTDYLIRAAEAINAREIAQYQDSSLSGGSNIAETNTGQAFFTPGDANKFRYGSRTVINVGTLPNTATTSVAHGINVTSNTVFTRIYGTASIPGTTFIPIPHAETAGNHVEVSVDATNVNITTVSDYSLYTQCYIVLEWIESV